MAEAAQRSRSKFALQFRRDADKRAAERVSSSLRRRSCKRQMTFVGIDEGHYRVPVRGDYTAVCLATRSGHARARTRVESAAGKTRAETLNRRPCYTIITGSDEGAALSAISQNRGRFFEIAECN